MLAPIKLQNSSRPAKFDFAESSNLENSTTSGCGEIGDCITINCDNKCGCDSSSAVLFYNETLDECVVNVKKLLQTLTEKYNNQAAISDKIRLNVERVFQGVIFSGILFGSCASLCVITACIYCIRINYEDTRLKNDVEALAVKLKRECRFKNMSTKQPTQPASESCNIIVEEAGVFVV
ncbi:uncharacterized protein LOC125072206 [Vanessa atalanta]|uniref:uncharacterized protein LOC125072206 n=1 Tax=Vanessa atalanta TaxID=42275 RepID=UPI001FCCF172|nr:uncharacterized protein LOC125072206 [Vanessa atalanta]